MEEERESKTPPTTDQDASSLPHQRETTEPGGTEPAPDEAATPGRGTNSSAVEVVRVLAAQWQEKYGITPGRRQLASMKADAAAALSDGDNPDWLTDAVVPFMVRRRYLDLGRARTHRDCPSPKAAATATPDGMCPEHPTYRAGRRCIPCVMA